MLSPDLDDFLTKTYPLLYRDRHHEDRKNKTLMDRGFQIRDGWFVLLNEVSATIEAEILRTQNELGVEYKDLPRAFEVTQEWGQLKLRMTGPNKTMTAAVAEAEQRSRWICEECGSPGKKRSGFVQEYPLAAVLCDDHNFLES